MTGPDPREALAALPCLEPPPDVLAGWQTALAEAPSPVRTRPAAPGRAAFPPGPPLGRAPRRATDRRAREGHTARSVYPVMLRLAAAVLPIATVLALSSADTTNDSRPLALRTDQLSIPATLTGLHAPTCPSRIIDGHPIGERNVLLDGRPGRLLVVTTDKPGRLRAVVLSPDCATVLADTLVGR